MAIRTNTHVLPSRLVYGKDGPHSFGGAPIHDGTHPVGSRLPIHRILTLSASDPLFPLSDYPHKTLPLYYPLAFSFGGGEIQYAVTSETAIEVIYLSDEVSDEHPYVIVDQFPEKRGRLLAFTYEEARAIAMVDCKLPYKLSNVDDRLVESCQAFNSIRIAADILTCQGEVFAPCRNDRCDWNGCDVKVPVFALVPCAEMHAGELWHEYSKFVELCFGLCRSCGTIIACNRCT